MFRLDYENAAFIDALFVEGVNALYTEAVIRRFRENGT